MDDNTVRQAARDHAEGVVAGDLRRAGAYLTREAQEGAGAVMKVIPNPATEAEVTSVSPSGDEFLVTIRYAGPQGEAVVASRWIDAGGPKIVGFDS